MIKATLLAILLANGSTFAAPGKLHNIVIIYADDLGYGDPSCYNPEAAYETPRLDRMAAEGIRFTDAHSPSTICSPSRYALFSGQQIYRPTGGGGPAFEGPHGPSSLKPGTLTLGAMLQEKGKWGRRERANVQPEGGMPSKMPQPGSHGQILVKFLYANMTYIHG